MKKHLSATQLKMWIRCSMQWYFRYVEGKKLPPAAAMTLGGSVDTSLNHNYKQKVDTFEDLPIDDILDVFSTTFEARKGSTDWKDDKPAVVKDQGVGCLKAYGHEIMPGVQPSTVQLKVDVPLEFSYDFIGYIDLIDVDSIIIDNKTAGRSPSQNMQTKVYDVGDSALQMLGYEWAYRSLNGCPSSGLRIDYMIKTKVPETLQVSLGKPSENDMNYFLKMLAVVAHGIDNKAYIPNRYQYLCSPKWCGYWDVCHQEFDGNKNFSY